MGLMRLVLHRYNPRYSNMKNNSQQELSFKVEFPLKYAVARGVSQAVQGSDFEPVHFQKYDL